MEFTIILLNVKKILIVYSNYFKGAKKRWIAETPSQQFADLITQTHNNIEVQD